MNRFYRYILGTLLGCMPQVQSSLAQDLQKFKAWAAEQVPQSVKSKYSQLQDAWQENFGTEPDVFIPLTSQQINDLLPSQKARYQEMKERAERQGAPTIRFRNLITQGLQSEIDRQNLIDQYNKDNRALTMRYWADKKPLIQEGLLRGMGYYGPQEFASTPLELPAEGEYYQALRNLAEQHRKLDIPYAKEREVLGSTFTGKKQELEAARREMLTKGLLPYASGTLGAAAALRKLGLVGPKQFVTNPAARALVGSSWLTGASFPLFWYWIMHGKPLTEKELQDIQMGLYF